MSERPAVYQASRSGPGGNRSQAHSGLVGAVQEYLRWRGAYVVKILGGLGQRTGLPDVFAAFPPSGAQQQAGQLVASFVAVECKTGAGRLSKVQERERAAMEQAGVLYVECRELEQVEEALVQAGLVTTRALYRREVCDG